MTFNPFSLHPNNLTFHSPSRHFLSFLFTSSSKQILKEIKKIGRVLERVLGSRERLLFHSLRSVTVTANFLLHLPPLTRLVSQTGMVPAEGTPTLKSVRVSTLGCQSIIDNDVPGSWNLCYLYYLNGPSLVGQIRRLVHV